MEHTNFRQIIRMIEKDVPCDSDARMERVLKNLYPLTLRIPVARRSYLAMAASLLLVCGGILYYNAVIKKPNPCPCWHFVGFDAGNSRHVPVLEQPGELLWRKPLHAAGGFAKPLAWKNLVIVSVKGEKNSSSSIEGYDASTGGLVWKVPFNEGAPNRNKSSSDRFLQDGKLYVSNGSVCMTLDAATGKILARINPPAGVKGWSYLSSDRKGLIGSSSDNRTLFKIDAETGKVLWTSAIAGSMGQPAIRGHTLYCHTDQGELLAMDTRKGLRLWSKALPEGRAASRLYVNNEWGVAVTEQNDAIVFRTSDGSVAWSKTVPGLFTSGLALGMDTLYIDGGKTALALGTGESRVSEADTLGRCAPPVLAGNQVIESFRLNSVLAACEGIILAGSRFFTVSDGYLMAFSVVAGNS